MSWYRIIDTIDGGHHSMAIENEDGMVFARSEGSSFFHAFALLQEALPPTTRDKHDYWVQPLDERESDYDNSPH